MHHALTFVDRVYEAAAVPEFWPKVLNEFSHIAGARDSLLISMKQTGIESVASSTDFQNLCGEHYSYPSGLERTRRLLALQRAGFVSDSDVFTEEEILSEPVFAELLIPRGYGRGVATSIQLPNGDSIIFHAERGHQQGKFERTGMDKLDAIRPHLARASLLASRLGLERAKAISNALNAIGLPAATLDLKGRVLSANNLITEMIPHFLQDRADRVVFRSKPADLLLERAIETIRQPDPKITVCSIPIPASEVEGPVIFHLLPITGAASDIFFRSSMLLIATPVTPKKVPDATVLQALFDLTPAEAQVAQQLGDGNSLDEIAVSLGKTATTIRNQIAAVLSKAGLHRRVDLVALLQGTAIIDTGKAEHN